MKKGRLRKCVIAGALTGSILLGAGGAFVGNGAVRVGRDVAEVARAAVGIENPADENEQGDREGGGQSLAALLAA